MTRWLLPLLVIASLVLAQGRGSRWERLSRRDADGDGKISRDEFPGQDRMFDRMDADGDGVVTEAEASGSASRSGSRGGSQDVEWVTKRLDMDRDGTFDEKDVAKIVQAADKDGDGKVSRAELVDFLLHKDRPIPRGTAPTEGSPAPAFEVRALEGTGTIKLASLVAKKRPTVVAFGSLT